jgi:hypothetical protein
MQSVPITTLNRIGGVMVSVLALSVVDRGFEPRSGQTKDYKFGICCFSAKHAALRNDNKNHWRCEFESQSGQGVQHYVIKFVSYLRQVGGFLRVLWIPPPIKLTATI